MLVGSVGIVAVACCDRIAVALACSVDVRGSWRCLEMSRKPRKADITNRYVPKLPGCAMGVKICVLMRRASILAHVWYSRVLIEACWLHGEAIVRESRLW